jgi:drug/metabolite transporter (DMT)-like permease
MSSRAGALVSVIALMLVWGSTFVVTKATVQEIPPLALGALRFTMAAVVLVPVAVARGGLRSLPQPLPLGSLVMMGVTGIALFHIAFNLALVHGSASQGALIYALVPAAVAVAAVLCLRERLSRRRIVGIMLSIAGIVVVISSAEVSGHSPRPLLGAVWMLVAVVTWAAYTIVAKRLADADQVVVIACTTVIGVLVMIPSAVWELRHGAWPAPSLQGWLGALFLGIVASAVGFIVYSRALRELDASLVGVLVNLDPIVGVLTAALFLGEPLRVLQIGGGAVAISGMWLAASHVGSNEQRATTE